MLIETHLDGYVKDKVAMAIDRLKAFEPEEGYYLAFSGGKDSQCIYHLAKEAGVKFDAHYNVTGIDPPELVHFIKSNYPDVLFEMYKLSMWKLIVKNVYPPTRNSRYCCKELKERGGEGRICVTGVRWAESSNRAANRTVYEVMTRKKADKVLFNDNEEGRMMFENCQVKGKRIINPVVDWSDSDIWDYLNSRKIPHCKLYDEGFHRLGCIGCPQGNTAQREYQFNRWPKLKEAYLRAFGRMIDERQHRGLITDWETPEQVIEWWIYGTVKGIPIVEGQMDITESA